MHVGHLMDEQKLREECESCPIDRVLVLGSYPSIISGQDLILYNMVDLSEHIILVSFLLNSDIASKV